MRALEPLRLNPRRGFIGRARGERLTRRKGISVEFADYRDYAYGDDTRHLDWNVLARLESPVIKTYHDEEDLALYLLLDCSKSMDFGEPTKFFVASQAALALGFVGLNSQDAVYVHHLSRRTAVLPPYRSRAAYSKLSSWVSAQAAEDSVPLGVSLGEFLSAAPRAGIAAIFSDGLDPQVGRAVTLLSARGFEVWFVQVLSDLELDPEIEGDLKLIDSESGNEVEITASGEIVETYRRNLADHCRSLAETCKKAGGHHTVLRTGDDLLDVVDRAFRREGWLRT
jgi:uncharacterized protein (DUF58 family)